MGKVYRIPPADASWVYSFDRNHARCGIPAPDIVGFTCNTGYSTVYSVLYYRHHHSFDWILFSQFPVWSSTYRPHVVLTSTVINSMKISMVLYMLDVGTSRQDTISDPPSVLWYNTQHKYAPRRNSIKYSTWIILYSMSWSERSESVNSLPLKGCYY